MNELNFYSQQTKKRTQKKEKKSIKNMSNTGMNGMSWTILINSAEKILSNFLFYRSMFNYVGFIRVDHKKLFLSVLTHEFCVGA